MSKSILTPIPPIPRIFTRRKQSSRLRKKTQAHAYPYPFPRKGFLKVLPLGEDLGEALSPPPTKKEPGLRLFFEIRIY